MITTMKPRILVAREVFPEVLERLRQHVEVDDNQADIILDVVGLKARIADKHGVMTALSDPVTADVIMVTELGLMKPTAHLFNVVRGGIVDNVVRGGIVDNVVLTPHIDSSSRATWMAIAMTAADNLIAALAGQRPPNLLNSDVLA